MNSRSVIPNAITTIALAQPETCVGIRAWRNWVRRTPKKVDVRIRFEKYVNRRGDNGCHIWTGPPGDVGYGNFGINGKTYRSHRAAWEIYRGPIPGGLCVLHRCDNKMCVNPDHLFLGTRADNVADMMAKGRGRKATGERVGNSKLKEDQVKEIRMLVAGGMKQTEVAAKFGVHSSWVSRISRNEFWRDI